jgi:outer membrane protein OmpA-like peptidoglycan-associated protein
VTKILATRTISAVLLVGGLAVAPLLDYGNIGNTASLDPLPVPAATFQGHWRQGELSLSGHTRSQQHEQELLQVAAVAFPSQTVVTDFQPLGIAPDYWADTTTRLVSLLAETISADAILTENDITIRAVVVDGPAWQSRLDAVRKVLPAELAVSTDTLLVDGSANVSEICARAFAMFKTGAINFEESSAEFRSSAYPRLDRVVALADACKQSRITITGHTDASGNEAWNRRLSLKRAAAVGDYIVQGGIDRARLLISGAGSAVPIADNSTRYGRSLNRRIEIALTGN